VKIDRIIAYVSLLTGCKSLTTSLGSRSMSMSISMVPGSILVMGKSQSIWEYSWGTVCKSSNSIPIGGMGEKSRRLNR